MQFQSFQSLALPALAAAALLLSPASFGATINNVSYQNTSAADSSEDTSAVRSQFRSSGSVGGVVTSGNSVSVSTVTQWVGAYQVNVAGPANLLFIYPSLSLSFTVDDPTNLGYSLDASTVLRGYLSTLYTGGPDFEQAIIASGTTLYASVDTGSGSATNLQITSFGDFIASNSSTPSVNRLVNATGNSNIGNFVGTRNFNFVFGSSPSPAGTIVFQNDYTGEAAIRFGMATTVPGLQSTYPGADGEAASTHGHFLTVTATFNEANNAVPEPTTTALMGLGLFAIGVIAKKRR